MIMIPNINLNPALIFLKTIREINNGIEVTKKAPIFKIMDPACCASSVPESVAITDINNTRKYKGLSTNPNIE